MEVRAKEGVGEESGQGVDDGGDEGYRGKVVGVVALSDIRLILTNGPLPFFWTELESRSQSSLSELSENVTKCSSTTIGIVAI